jgi:hypothetical protein
MRSEVECYYQGCIFKSKEREKRRGLGEEIIYKKRNSISCSVLL